MQRLIMMPPACLAPHARTGFNLAACTMDRSLGHTSGGVASSEAKKPAVSSKTAMRQEEAAPSQARVREARTRVVSDEMFNDIYAPSACFWLCIRRVVLDRGSLYLSWTP